MSETPKLLTITWDEIERDDVSALRREVLAQAERVAELEAELLKLRRHTSKLAQSHRILNDCGSTNEECRSNEGMCRRHLGEQADFFSTQLQRLREENARLTEAAEMLWVILANVSGGDWSLQAPEWQEAAARWRDNYHNALAPAPQERDPAADLRQRATEEREGSR